MSELTDRLEDACERIANREDLIEVDATLLLDLLADRRAYQDPDLVVLHADLRTHKETIRELTEALRLYQKPSEPVTPKGAVRRCPNRKNMVGAAMQPCTLEAGHKGKCHPVHPDPAYSTMFERLDRIIDMETRAAEKPSEPACHECGSTDIQTQADAECLTRHCRNCSYDWIDLIRGRATKEDPEPRSKEQSNG